MTKEMWWNLWDEQEGLDPITKEKLKIKTCHVDHCHRTGRIRGLLNGSTNRALGFFRDDQEALKRAIEYLNETSVQPFSTERDADKLGLSETDSL